MGGLPAIVLNVTAKNGNSLEFALSPNDAQQFISYVISVMQTSVSHHALSKQGEQPSPSSITATPIEARDIGYAKGRTSSEQLVAIDIGQFQLVFAVPVHQRKDS